MVTASIVPPIGFGWACGSRCGCIGVEVADLPGADGTERGRSIRQVQARHRAWVPVDDDGLAVIEGDVGRRDRCR